MDSFAPQIITSVSTLCGVGLTLLASSIQRRGDHRREDRHRFNDLRIKAAADLLDAARAYRHAVLASHVLVSATQIDDTARHRWAVKLQEAFEYYHGRVAHADLILPDDIRTQIHSLSQRLDALRSVEPNESIEPANALCRNASDQLNEAMRTLVAVNG